MVLRQKLFGYFSFTIITKLSLNLYKELKTFKRTTVHFVPSHMTPRTKNFKRKKYIIICQLTSDFKDRVDVETKTNTVFIIF